MTLKCAVRQTTQHTMCTTLGAAEVIPKLETAVYSSAIWFDSNNMKLNAEKCHLLIFGKNRENFLGGG